MATLKKTKKIISILTHDFTIVFCFSLFVIVHRTCVHVYMHAYKHMVQYDDDDEKKYSKNKFSHTQTNQTKWKEIMIKFF